MLCSQNKSHGSFVILAIAHFDPKSVHWNQASSSCSEQRKQQPKTVDVLVCVTNQKLSELVLAAFSDNAASNNILPLGS